MLFTYTRAYFKSYVNRKIQNKSGMLVDFNETCNDAVRAVVNDVDLKSSRREVALTPNLFNGQYDYAGPSDLNRNGLIDIPQQAKREDGEFFLVSPREFDVNPQPGQVAIDDYNGARVLKIASKVSDQALVLSELDDLASGGGLWSAYGDAANLMADPDDYIKGSGCLKFGINSNGGTTAGIQNSSLNTFDFSDYLNGNGAIFVWAKINDPTKITNYILEVGNDSGNCYKKTIVAKNDGTGFVAGWNLLRFDMTNLTTVGSPSAKTFKYIALYMTKTTDKINESDYKFDYLVMRVGKSASIKYYSNYGWVSSDGVYKETSTDDSDLLVSDSDEWALYVAKAVEIAMQELDILVGGRMPLAGQQMSEQKYESEKKKYLNDNPSERMIMTTEYYSYKNNQPNSIFGNNNI